MATLHEYYVSDFARLMNAFAEHKALNPKTGAEVPISVRVHLDFDACVRFVSLFVPAGVSPTEVANHYINNPQEALRIGEGVLVLSGYGDRSNHLSSADLSFSGRMFLYSEESLDPVALAATDALARSKGIRLAVRSTDYRDARARYEKPLAFISHDTRDKKEVAEPIAVEKGIKECRTCVLILSPNFLANEGWTKAEFDSIYTREIMEKSNVMLPVWHNVGTKEVYDYSPRLADKKGISTEKGIEEVVRQLKVAIDSHK